MNLCFTKEDSLTAKGIAIICMLTYHLFHYDHQLTDFNVIYKPLSENTFLTITGFGNICVAVFLFITSYGIARGLRNNDNSPEPAEMIRQSLKRLGRLCLNFAAMYLSVVLIWNKYFDHAARYGEGWQGKLQQLLDMFGFANLLGLPTLNNDWWYMELAILAILFVPFACLAFRRTGPVLLLPAMAVPYLITLPYDVNRYYMVMLLGAAIGCLDEVPGPSYEKKIPFLGKLLLFFVLIAGCVLFRQNYFVYNHLTWLVDGPIAFLILWGCREIIGRIPVVRAVIRFLGKYSMNIYFVHMFFYMAIYQQFIYSFRYAGLILLVLLLVTLAYSVLLEAVKGLMKRGWSFGKQFLQTRSLQGKQH